MWSHNVLCTHEGVHFRVFTHTSFKYAHQLFWMWPQLVVPSESANTHATRAHSHVRGCSAVAVIYVCCPMLHDQLCEKWPDEPALHSCAQLFLELGGEGEGSLKVKGLTHYSHSEIH